MLFHLIPDIHHREEVRPDFLVNVRHIQAKKPPTRHPWNEEDPDYPHKRSRMPHLSQDRSEASLGFSRYTPDSFQSMHPLLFSPFQLLHWFQLADIGISHLSFPTMDIPTLVPHWPVLISLLFPDCFPALLPASKAVPSVPGFLLAKSVPGVGSRSHNLPPLAHSPAP